MEKFSSFTEAKKGKPYKLVIFNHSGEFIRDVKDTSLGIMTKMMEKAAKAAGIKMYSVDFVGVNFQEKNGKKYINSFIHD